MKKLLVCLSLVILCHSNLRAHDELETHVNLDGLIDMLSDIENNIDNTALISSSAFSAEYTTATLTGSGKWWGAIFTTGTAEGFIDVWDSTSVDKSKNITPTRIYNSGIFSTGTIRAGFSGSVTPMKYKKGLIWKPNLATFNSISLLHNTD